MGVMITRDESLILEENAFRQMQFIDHFSEIENIRNKKLENVNYGKVDFRALHTLNLGAGALKNLVYAIYNNKPLIAGCTDDIIANTDLLLKKCPLFLNNKAVNPNPDKWVIYEYPKLSSIVLEKAVPLDADKKTLFDSAGIKTQKDIDKALGTIRSFHAAVRTNSNIEIENSFETLKALYEQLWDGYKALMVSTSHEALYTPIDLIIFNYTANIFGKITIDDWVLLPRLWHMITKYSPGQLNMDMEMEPMFLQDKLETYPGTMLVRIGAWITYKANLFGNKFQFNRNGKEY
jgi:hypothetical protein